MDSRLAHVSRRENDNQNVNVLPQQRLSKKKSLILESLYH